VHEAVTTYRPFPWASFESLTYADVAARQALGRWGESQAVARDIARALHEVTGARVEISIRRVRRAAEPRPLDGSVAVVLAGPDERSLGRGVLLEAEGALAAALVARALERPAPKLIDPARPGSARVAGALAAIVLAAARRSHAGAPLRVLTAGPGAALTSDFARFAPDGIVAELTVIVDDTAHLARVVVDRGAAFASASRPWDRARLATLGDVPLVLPVVVSASAGAAFEVSSLSVGDVWIPGVWPLARGPGGAWVGPVTLAAPHLEVGVRATLGEDGRIVLRGGVEDLAWTPPTREGEAMTEANDTDVLVEAVGEVPVVVRVEIGVAEMRARDWAAITPGDIIALRRRVADPVVLRVGGIELARGELVDIEGDVGVRVTERLERREART
jgi:flagellar motor switch/type III secretory pathway protein FliN